jgi:hypothetical protein
MLAMFRAGEGASTGWMWVRLMLFAVLASVVVQLGITGAQMRVLTLGRAALGWPLTDAYYVTIVGGSGVGSSTPLTTQSHFDVVPGALAANLALGVAVFLVVILLLRLAWNRGR